MPLDPEQPRRQQRRMIAIRSERAKIKKAIRDGELDPWALLEGNDNTHEGWIITMKIHDLLRAVPGIGEVTAYDILTELSLPPNMRFVGVSMELRKEMSAMAQEVLAG